MNLTRGPDRGIGDTAASARVLAFGQLPDELAPDGILFTIVDANAASQVVRASRCRTWGDYVSLVGLGWLQATRDFGGFLADLNGGRLPDPHSRFRYSEVFGATLEQGEAAYSVARWLPEPREAALEALEQLGPAVTAWFSSPGLDVEYGSPVGQIAGLFAADAEIFRSLQEAIRKDGERSIRVERDDALVRACLLLEA